MWDYVKYIVQLQREGDPASAELNHFYQLTGREKMLYLLQKYNSFTPLVGTTLTTNTSEIANLLNHNVEFRPDFRGFDQSHK